jgi:hypothetical protein
MQSIGYSFTYQIRGMKSLGIIILILCCFTIFPLSAQKNPTFKVWITLLDESKIKGTLFDVNERELEVLNIDLTKAQIEPERIKTIKLRRTGKIGRGAWVGALAGTAVGGLSGYAGGDDEPGWFSWSAEEKGVVGIMLGAPIGTLAGMVLSTPQDIFAINGNLNTYIAVLPQLKTYLPNPVFR